MNICVVGTGYVGLVSGVCFSEIGHQVTCVDRDEAKLARLDRGDVPIFEPGLPELLVRNKAAGRLRFTDDLDGAIQAAEIVVVAVGTPPRPTDGGADLTAVFEVVRAVAEKARRPTILVVKSTVPVGTNERVRELVQGAAAPIEVVSNPEFLKEGDAVNDFMRPDRIVVGVRPVDRRARDVMRRAYHPLCLDADHIVWMDPASAELTKYVSNAMLAMRVSFMNEIATLCEKVGADVHSVRVGVGSDKRIGPKFLYAGPGYGGSCFPKDVSALIRTARDLGVPLELAEATQRVNERQRGVLASKLRRRFDGSLRDRRIALWGLSFKPRTDDIRESPALDLIEAVLAEGGSVVAHDPKAMEAVARLFGDRIQLVDDPYAAAEAADALVLVTEWTEYRSPDFERLRLALRRPLLVDGRNVWTDYAPWELGFTYDGIGALATSRAV